LGLVDGDANQKDTSDPVDQIIDLEFAQKPTPVESSEKPIKAKKRIDINQLHKK